MKILNLQIYSSLEPTPVRFYPITSSKMILSKSPVTITLLNLVISHQSSSYSVQYHLIYLINQDFDKTLTYYQDFLQESLSSLDSRTSLLNLFFLLSHWLFFFFLLYWFVLFHLLNAIWLELPRVYFLEPISSLYSSSLISLNYSLN